MDDDAVNPLWPSSGEDDDPNWYERIREKQKQEKLKKRREYMKGYNASANGKAAKARYRSSDHGKKKELEHSRTDKVKEQRKEYRESDHGRSVHKKHRDTEKFKVGARRRAKEPGAAIQNRLRQMLKHQDYESGTIHFSTEFGSNAEWRAHLETTFDGWMNWQNRGKHQHGDPYKVKWNIGHRIPCTLYDCRDPEDLRKCFSKANLFAQCARENIEQNARGIPSPMDLKRLRPVWPKCWESVVRVA